MPQTSTTPHEITAEEARRHVDLSALSFTTTADLEPLTTMVGQERAVKGEWSMQAELPTNTALKAIKNLKQITREEFILPGTSICGGCGGLQALRLAAKVLGPKTVFVNAAGCFTLLAVFPYTPFKGSWLYTTMASAAAGAQGVRDALDVLMARGKMAPEDDVEVVVVAGDGSTYDMALSSTSGAIFRGLDFWYFCYDNESYGNTGMQMSSATPYGVRTQTTPVGDRARVGTEHGKKDLFAI